jgi:histidinol-phosphate/aromatic aminotransferase/cobyric acid decarboxylase-like protein
LIKSLHVVPTAANFFLVDFGHNASDVVYDLLLKHGIYLRSMEDKVGLGPTWLRIASRKKEENDFLVEKLSVYLNEK